MAPRKSENATELNEKDKGEYHGNQARWNTLDEWLNVHGSSEYILWKKNNPSERLSYDEWCASQHVLGPYLYHATLDVWDDMTTTDEDADSEEEVDNLVSLGPPKRAPTKTVTRNKKGKSQTTGTPKSTAVASPNEPGSSAKRKRKPKKKFLSEEIVASDDSEDVEESQTTADITPSANSAKPEANGTTNGQRKSSGRKPKKKFLSEETISPEDMEDEPETIEEVITPVIRSTMPVRPSPKALAAANKAETPKKITLRLGTGKKSRKKYLSEATVHDEDSEDDDATKDAPSSTTSTTTNPNLDTPTASPDQEDVSPSSRRGLRVRTPAQQRPYFHHAKLFEDQEPADAESGVKRSPKARTSRLSHVSYPDDENEVQYLSDNASGTLPNSDDLPHSEQKPRHFKGKGRAWKKGEEDEDHDFTLKKKPQKGPKAKKGGRPKKTPRTSEVTVQDESELGAEKTENETSPQSVGNSVGNKAPKPRGRGRKSDQSTSSRASLDQYQNDDDAGASSKRTASTTSHKRARAPTVASADEAHDQGRDENNERASESQQLNSSPSRKMQKRASPESNTIAH